MLVEHTFITTLDEEPAFTRASEYLGRWGFSLEERGAGRLVMRRGLKTSKKTVSFDRLPQTVEFEFDRGRVTVVAAIQEPGKVHRLHRDLVLTIVRAMEAVLAHDATGEGHASTWTHVHNEIQREHQRRRGWQNCGIGCLVIFIAFLVFSAIYAAFFA